MIKSLMVYTLSNNSLLNDIFNDIYVMHSLKRDIKQFCDQISKKKPKYILGLADGHYKNSKIEPIAINVFNKNKKIIKGGQDKLSLFTPGFTNEAFGISNYPTDSFCNYSMYKIQHFLVENYLESKFVFIHINLNDLELLSNYLEKVLV